MKRILLRSAKDPATRISPEETLARSVTGSNSGNLLFSHASHRLLSRCDTEVVSNGLQFGRADPARINAEFDHLVLPMANALRPGFRTRLDVLSTLIEELTIPVTVLSIGTQTDVSSDTGYLTGLEDSVRRFAHAVLDHSPAIGVRGASTAQYLNDLGITDVEIIGCPSMFLRGPDVHVVRGHPSLSTDARLAFSATARVAAMGPITRDHYEKFPNLRLIAQDDLSLDLLLWGNERAHPAQDPNMPFHADHPLFREDKVRFFVDASPWIDYQRTMDFAFGDRIHGTISAILAGVPAFLLAHDSRVLELARYHEIPHMLIDDVKPGMDARDFYERADFTRLNETHAERWATFAGFLDRQGLQHGLDDHAQLHRFDHRIQSADLPPAVRAITADRRGDLASRVEWLGRQASVLDDQQTRERRSREASEKAIRGQLEAQQKRVRSLQDEVAAARLALDALTKQARSPAQLRRTKLKRRIRRTAARLLRR